MRNKEDNDLLAEAYSSIYNEGLFDGLKNMVTGKMAPEAKPKQPAAAPTQQAAVPAQQAAAQQPGQSAGQDAPFRAKLDELNKARQLEIRKVYPDKVNTEIAEVMFGGKLFDIEFVTKTADTNIPGIVKGNLRAIEFADIDDEDVTPDQEAVRKKLGDLIGSHGQRVR